MQFNVFRFKTEEEAVAIANSTTSGLSGKLSNENLSEVMV